MSVFLTARARHSPLRRLCDYQHHRTEAQCATVWRDHLTMARRCGQACRLHRLDRVPIRARAGLPVVGRSASTATSPDPIARREPERASQRQRGANEPTAPSRGDGLARGTIGSVTSDDFSLTCQVTPRKPPNRPSGAPRGRAARRHAPAMPAPPAPAGRGVWRQGAWHPRAGKAGAAQEGKPRFCALTTSCQTSHAAPTRLWHNPT